MKIWGNRRRLCFSGWILAALFLIGLNSFHLLAMLNQQLVGDSPTIKTLRRNLGEWEQALIKQTWSGAGSRLNSVMVRRMQPESASAGLLPGEADPAIAPSDSPPPHVLKGLLRVLDREGRQTYWAVLDGRVYRTADRVGPFVVEQISPAGVVLSRDGRQWQIACPNPEYSEDKGY